MEITTLVMFGMQGLLTLAMAFGMFILNGIKSSVEKVDKKLDLAQTKENCLNFHASHDKIHDVEKEYTERWKQKMEQDMNNVGAIARKVNKN